MLADRPTRNHLTCSPRIDVSSCLGLSLVLMDSLRISLCRLVYFTICVSAFCQSAQRHRNRSSFRHQMGPLPVLACYRRRPPAACSILAGRSDILKTIICVSDRSFVQRAVLSWHFGFTEEQAVSFYAVFAASRCVRVRVLLCWLPTGMLFYPEPQIG